MLGGRPFVRFAEKSADHPSHMGMMVMMMPGDGVGGHEIRVYQVIRAESNFGRGVCRGKVETSGFGKIDSSACRAGARAYPAIPSYRERFRRIAAGPRQGRAVVERRRAVLTGGHDARHYSNQGMAVLAVTEIRSETPPTGTFHFAVTISDGVWARIETGLRWPLAYPQRKPGASTGGDPRITAESGDRMDRAPSRTRGGRKCAVVRYLGQRRGAKRNRGLFSSSHYQSLPAFGLSSTDDRRSRPDRHKVRECGAARTFSLAPSTS